MKSKLLLGILGAAAAGVVIGLLVAPEKGTEMRRRIRKTTDGWTDALGNLFTKAEDESDHMAHSAKRNKEMPTGG